MNTPPRKIIVLDTNVLIRTTFQKQSSVSKRIYLAIKNQECILAFSPPILEEIRDVINRDKIIIYTHTTTDMRTRYINNLIDIGILTPGTKKLSKESRDREDKAQRQASFQTALRL
jgi:predicted nucleic acid-binding protein